MKKRLSTLSNEHSNTSHCDKEMFFQIYSPRLMEKSGTDTSYLFDKYIENISFDAQNSTIVTKLNTPKVPSVYDKGYQPPAQPVKPENSIILYKIINPEDIISRCTLRNLEQRSLSRDTTPMISAGSRPSISRKFPNLSKSPMPWEREHSRLSRISSAKKLSSRSPAMVNEERAKNGKIDFFIRGQANNLDASHSKPRLASISKGKLKIIRNREVVKESSFNRSLLQQAAHENTVESLNKPKDIISSKIKLPSSWKSKSVKTLEKKSKEIQQILKKSSPIKLIYSNTSISVKAKKF